MSLKKYKSQGKAVEVTPMLQEKALPLLASRGVAKYSTEQFSLLILIDSKACTHAQQLFGVDGGGAAGAAHPATRHVTRRHLGFFY